MNPKIIDFIIIGAARSGTTSLFMYLKAHPQIFMPLEKEVCFFSDHDRYVLGSHWYLENYFARVDPSKIKGEATPAYMLFTYVPKRICSVTPGTKLIAILRNPIERAYSHYRFAKRLNLEKREFHAAIEYLINRGPVSDDKIGSQNLEYLMFGDFGKSIKRYLQFFSRSQIKIIFYEDLKRNPQATMEKIYEFLGVDPQFESGLFKKKYNVGGQTRFSSLLRIQIWLKTEQRIKDLLLTIFPPKILGAIDMWMTTTGNLKPTKESGMDYKTFQLLREYYSDDVSLLEELIGEIPPWPVFS